MKKTGLIFNLIFLICLVSCNSFFQGKNVPLNEPLYTVTGSFQSDESIDINDVVNQLQTKNNLRTARPSTENLNYTATATKYENDKTTVAGIDPVNGTVNVSSKTFSFILSSGFWKIKIEAKLNDITVLSGESSVFNVSAEQSVPQNFSITIQPSQNGNGYIQLPINFENGCDINAIQVTWNKMEDTDRIGYFVFNVPSGENPFILFFKEKDSNTKDTPLASGTYKFQMAFVKQEGNNITKKYFCTEYISVYDNLVTNKWVNSGSPYITDGNFKITNALIEKYTKDPPTLTEYYVNANVTELKKNALLGTSFNPMNNISDALNEIKASDSTKEYTIYLQGTFTKTTDSTTEESMLTIGEYDATNTQNNWSPKIKIEGYGDGATLDANSKGRVILLKNGTLTIGNNITITGGKAESGAGIYVSGENQDTKLYIDGEKTSITNNTATLQGGGVFEENYASFELNKGSISSNTVKHESDKVTDVRGGGIAAYGTVFISGGSISSNKTLFNNKNNTGTVYGSYGGGIYLGSNVHLVINGGEISENLAEAISDYGNNVKIVGGGIYSGSIQTIIHGGTFKNNKVLCTNSTELTDDFYANGIFIENPGSSGKIISVSGSPEFIEDEIYLANDLTRTSLPVVRNQSIPLESGNVLIDLQNYVEGLLIFYDVNQPSYYEKFKLKNTNYYIDNTGHVRKRE